MSIHQLDDRNPLPPPNGERCCVRGCEREALLARLRTLRFSVEKGAQIRLGYCTEHYGRACRFGQQTAA